MKKSLLLAGAVTLSTFGSLSFAENGLDSSAISIVSMVESDEFVASLVQDDEFSLSSNEALTITGITEPEQDVLLSVSMAGRIADIPISEGQQVSSGDLLLTLDTQPELLEVERTFLLWQDKSELEASRQQMEIYQLLYQNAKSLHEETGAISGEDLEGKKLQYLLQVAKTNQLEVNERKEKLEYQLARARLNKGQIIAPFEGVVTKVWLDKGESTQANKPLLRIVNSNRGRFIANVDESLGRKLSVNQSVELFIKAGDKYVLRQGTVAFVSPVTDSASNLIEVIIHFDNSDGEIKLGVSGYLEVS
ncbi:efflux RND transporter periplasmic adaptor subunit [Endozoicomonas atrinae]|uniref:efflux RND transporter periplasmic adaptor subunit n=1 Tax=Endozoicomonas atrinae TaxID=1333660 RepID=UPI0008243AA1|nr:efflux RND transporter periplasmic adaptor subunit [Endozoicomonas atrinae]